MRAAGLLAARWDYNRAKFEAWKKENKEKEGGTVRK
jgi:hypothetical protein